LQVETVEVVGSFLEYEAGVRCQFALNATVVFHRGQTELIEEAGLHIGWPLHDLPAPTCSLSHRATDPAPPPTS